jgi:CO/xanthine dehydrogenase FAD-binding subunit
MRTELAPGELLTAIDVPKLAKGTGASFVRLARVKGAFAIVNAAAVTTAAKATIAVGGATAAPVVVEVPHNGDATAAATAAGDASYAATEDAFGDLNGSAEYRREMARVFAGRALERAIATPTSRGGER